MLELLDPRNLDPMAYDRGYLKSIRAYSLLDGQRIGWNYCMDYTWLALRVEGLLRPGMRVIDIGCGPGAIHGYLEDKHNVDILGIDMNRWERDYVDIEGNFADDEVRSKNDISTDSLDAIISVSAFEHNSMPDHKRLVGACLQCLKPGGRLIVTLSAAPGRSRHSSNQWDLSRQDIEEIYGEQFEAFEYWSAWRRWRKHREIPINHKKRYGRWRLWDPRFLAVGADITKR